MLKLLTRAFRYNWSAQASNKANLWAALTAMIINNLMFLYGMWLMIFDGKKQNQTLFPYYLTLTVLAYIGWGTVNFFAGGLRMMSEIIDNGKLEPMLGTPRSPLFLLAISESSASALGDLIQGIITMAMLFWLCPYEWVLRAMLCSFVVIFAFASVFIFAGSLAFFMNRGSSVSFFIIESTLSFTMYPMGKILEGPGRMFLYIIPAALTAILPMNWIEDGDLSQFLIMMAATAVGFFLSLWFFHWGLKHYRAASYIGAR